MLFAHEKKVVLPGFTWFYRIRVWDWGSDVRVLGSGLWAGGKPERGWKMEDGEWREPAFAQGLRRGRPAFLIFPFLFMKPIETRFGV
jgi:hypothetical protein